MQFSSPSNFWSSFNLRAVVNAKEEMLLVEVEKADELKERVIYNIDQLSLQFSVSPTKL